MNSGSDFAKSIYLSNLSAWQNIEPVLHLTKSSSSTRVKKVQKRVSKKVTKEKVEAKSKREDYEVEGGKIKNPRFSLTSFLIPLCITGEKKDYQLLYCICSLKNALKVMSTTLRKEGFAQLYMVGMKTQVDWQRIRENNISFTDIIIEFLVKSGTVCMIAAHRKEAIKKVHKSDAPFVVVLSASDIRLPCQEIVCIGSSWMVFRRSTESRKNLFDREVYNCGRRALYTGIMINGCNTLMVCAFKKIGGIHYFMFDSATGDFRLYDDGCYLRPSGNLLCLNEVLFYKFSPALQEWLIKKKKGEDGKGYCSRYTGGWLVDGYRILRSGGLLLSPKDSGNSVGRIRYLQKAVPLAYLAEKAGGAASDGWAPILKIQSQRPADTSLVLGSVKDVENFMDNVTKPQAGKGNVPQYEADYDDTSTDIDE